MIELGAAEATSTASPDRFFAKWIDHATWPEWSPDTKWVKLQGPVELGTRGVLKPRGGPATKFFISSLERDRAYADTSVLPGAKLVFDHQIGPTAVGSQLAVSVTMSGPLARLWGAIMGKGFRDSAQADLDRLVAIVESEES